MKKTPATIALFFTLASYGQTPNAPQHTATPDGKAALLDTLYTNCYRAGTFNGNVLVAEKGRIIFQKSYGLANEATGEKLDTETVFELASVTKQFTAMGIVQLQKAGKLSYDDPVSRYIPELSRYEGLTVKNLLVHTGGLPDYMELAERHWDKSKIATNDDIIRLFQKLQPKSQFKPGQQWEYSNTGYLLLATIIERVSGKTFEQYLKERIFEPLDMNSTFVYRRRFRPREVVNYALGYLYSDSLKRKILPDENGKDFYVVYLDGIVGDGMVNSNLYDLLKWDRALYGNGLVNEADRELIFASYPVPGEKETAYGFGWTIAKYAPYGKIVNHSGGWGGYVTFIERHLDNDKTIIILQNNATPKTDMPVKNTRRILYNLPEEKPVQLAGRVLAQYAGTYITESGKESEILFEKDKLWVPLNPQVKLELIPVSETKFLVDGYTPEVSYDFITDVNGNVEGYRVQQPEMGIDRKATRKK